VHGGAADARLMRGAGLRGVTRAKTPRTTHPAPVPDGRPDLVDRVFTAAGRTGCGWPTSPIRLSSRLCAARLAGLEGPQRAPRGWIAGRSARAGEAHLAAQAAHHTVEAVPGRAAQPGGLCAGRRARRPPGRLDDDANAALFQVISQRYLKGSVIITSHAGIATWADRFADPMMAAAVLDRLLHRGIVAAIDGPSYRMRAHQARAEQLRQAVRP
jgi:hypothetical protein